MRVSTAQFYFQSSQQISNKSSDVNDQIGYISSGKRILTAKDDAVSFGTLAGYKEGLQILKDAGQGSLPGGGAEIFDEEIINEHIKEKEEKKEKIEQIKKEILEEENKLMDKKKLIEDLEK